MRCKDIRTENLGLNTFQDLETIFRKGQIVPAGDSSLGKIVSLQYGKFEIIINAVTRTLITLKPR